MREWLTALLLGFVEGLTEFIPVSSTAHLVVLTEGLKFQGPPGHVFEVFIQLGAILAVIVLYRHKLWHTAVSFPHDKTSRTFIYNLILGTIPAVIAGLAARDYIKEHLYNTTVIATALIVGGVIILLLDRHFNRTRLYAITEIDNIPMKTAFLIGCCQMLALVPGVSRSGATIMGSLGLGLARPVAAEFSFFLAIPVMLAAVTYDTYKSWENIVAYDHFGLMLAGMAAAFVTALVVIKLALHIISTYGFAPFAIYRIFAGAFILWVFV